MPSLREVEVLAEELLRKKPDPIPRFRLLRDVLEVSPYDALFTTSKSEALKSRWVLELEKTQETNGTWGRFHTQDSTVRKKFPTTERAISRALALGIDKESKMLKKTVAYMVRVIEGQDTWTDRQEKFNEWALGVQLITAATLAKIDRTNSALVNVWKLWAEIAKYAFSAGQYDAHEELQAYKKLTGITPTKKWPQFGNMYPLILLSATENKLPDEIERALLNWIWHKEEGVYYATSFSLQIFPEIQSKQFLAWLSLHEILSNFSNWKHLAQNAMNWLWENRDKYALWDFKSTGTGGHYFPLSDSWRKPVNRQIDCSTRALILLRKYCTD
jgi:hypothetical protein